MPDKPCKELRLGALKATIWANKTQDGKNIYNVTLSRLYKETDSPEWKFTSSINRDDLPVIGILTTECFKWIHRKIQTDKEEQEKGAIPEVDMYQPNH